MLGLAWDRSETSLATLLIRPHPAGGPWDADDPNMPVQVGPVGAWVRAGALRRADFRIVPLVTQNWAWGSRHSPAIVVVAAVDFALPPLGEIEDTAREA